MQAFAFVAMLTLAAAPALGQTTEIRNHIPDTAPPKAVSTGPMTKPEWDYVRRVEMVPMRDGTVRPYVNGGWEVDLRVELPDGTIIRERKKASATGKAAA